MDIRILRDGIELGPFPEDAVQTLLQQGNVSITDLAWRPGLPQWVPLANLLYATSTPPPPPGSVPPPPAPPQPAPVVEAEPIALPQVTTEPATPKQKAFLAYMGVQIGSEIDREAASQLVNEAMENPKDAARLARWNKDRLKLHPDLFAAEIQAAKEQRAQHFFEVCETQGAPYFTKVTKAHCQVLVGFLDVHHPNWDADEREAATNYFFPAIAEKFPQLLTKEGKGEFKYPEGPKVAKELTRRSPVVVKARRTSPATALARGVFFGALILGMLWFVKKVVDRGGASPKVAAEATPAPAAGGERMGLPTSPGPDAKATPDATASTPPATSSETLAVLGGTPAAGDMNATPPAMGTAEMTALAMSSGTPATIDPTAPATDPAAVIAPALPAPPGTALLLTKPVEIQSRFGKVKLPPGTRATLIQQNGSMVTVKVVGQDVVTMPASSTNLGSEGAAPPPPAVAPLNPAPAPPVTTPPPPTPAPDSLFGPAKSPGTARANPANDL